MATASDLKSQIASAKQQLAAMDLPPLQALAGVINNQNSTIAQIMQAIATAEAALADSDRLAQVTNLANSVQGIINALNAMVADAQAAANPPA